MARKFVPIPIDTMVKAGDAAHMPDGVSEELVNVFHRPGPRIEKRPAWKTDVSNGATTGLGFMKWFDKVTNVFRLVLDDNAAIRVKDAVTEAWSAPITTGYFGGVTDWTNYKNSMLWMTYKTAYGFPQYYGYNGIDIDVRPSRETLSSNSIVAWKDRVWFFNIWQSVFNRLGNLGQYGFTGWVFTNVAVKVVTANGTTTTTWTPTSTTSAKAELAGTTVLASTEDTYYVFRSDLLGMAPLYRVPLTLEIFVATSAARVTSYLVGAIRRPDTPNGFRYRALTSGLSGAGVPAWDVNIGSDTFDNAVTWHNDGPDAFESQEIEVDNATDNGGQFQTEGVRARIPPMPDSIVVGVRVKWGTQARTSWELQQITVGLKDGLTDGDPRKSNKGQQFTLGRFFYDFLNAESSSIAVIRYPNRIICTEAGLPREIRNDMYWEVVDGSEGGVVIRPLSDVMCAYKRDNITTYGVVTGTAAAALPMKQLAVFPGVGCLDPFAIGEFEGRHFFIGDQGVYAFDGQTPPVEITGDGMREAIFARSGNWVEDNSRKPILRVDTKNRELRIYTQIDRIWIYSIDSKKWTSENIIQDSIGTPATGITDLAYYRNKFYAIAIPNGIVREDPTSVLDDVWSFGSFEVTAEVWLHPFESIPMQDTLVESIELHHEITGTQVGSVLEVGVSFDRGATFPKEHEITIPVTSDKEPIVVPLWQAGENLTLRLRHRGLAGPSYFNLFWAGVWLQTLGPSVNDSTPASVSVTLS